MDNKGGENSGTLATVMTGLGSDSGHGSALVMVVGAGYELGVGWKTPRQPLSFLFSCPSVHSNILQ